MKLAHSVCAGEILSGLSCGDCWGCGAWPDPVLAAVQLGLALAGSAMPFQADPQAPFQGDGVV